MLVELYESLPCKAVLFPDCIYLPTVDKYIRMYASNDIIPKIIYDGKIMTINELDLPHEEKEDLLLAF